jgi:hypothetical protein
MLIIDWAQQVHNFCFYEARDGTTNESQSARDVLPFAGASARAGCGPWRLRLEPERERTEQDERTRRTGRT